MGQATEVELVRRVSRGDREAYATLLGIQLASVSRYVARMLGDPVEAEDITQEVFLRLWTQADRYDASRAKLSTWLHNIAHNLCIDHFRKHSRLVSEDEANEPTGDEPEVSLLASLTANDISKGIMTLPERQRSAVVLCHYQGLSNKDAAVVLEVSVDALESLLARAKRKLKQELAQYGDNHGH